MKEEKLSLLKRCECYTKYRSQNAKWEFADSCWAQLRLGWVISGSETDTRRRSSGPSSTSSGLCGFGFWPVRLRLQPSCLPFRWVALKRRWNVAYYMPRKQHTALSKGELVLQRLLAFILHQGMLELCLLSYPLIVCRQITLSIHHGILKPVST